LKKLGKENRGERLFKIVLEESIFLESVNASNGLFDCTS